MGRKSSVYLNNRTLEMLQLAGDPPLAQLVDEALSIRLAGKVSKPKVTGGCPHPKARRSKGGLCMACGENVGDKQ